jgi:hypothetical protein
VDGEIADQLEIVTGVLGRAPDAPASESNGRVLLDIEEVRRPKMLVALLGPGIERRRIDLSLNGRAIRILLVDHDAARDLREPPLHRRDHQVLGRELHQGVVGIDLPGGGSGPGNLLLNCAHRLLRLNDLFLERNLHYLEFLDFKIYNQTNQGSPWAKRPNRFNKAEAIRCSSVVRPAIARRTSSR